MPLSDADSEELERLAPDKIRSKLASAGAGRNAVVQGLGNGMMLRGDVEDWLAERDRESAKREADTLSFNKAAALLDRLQVSDSASTAAARPDPLGSR
jgi:hypothetical protein